MIRGAIDYIDQYRVGGWLYSDVSAVKGKTVLAFLNKECVGAGTVEHFRQDLADAGLDDGYVGFNFGISVPEDVSPEAVIVKFDGSDLVLMQSASVVVAGDEQTLTHLHRTYSVEAIEWMRARGWLEQTEFDFLRCVSTIGLYDRSLRTGNQTSGAAEEAARLFELYAQGPVQIESLTVNLADLAELRLSLINDSVVPLAAIHAKAGIVSIVEGSQRDEDWAAGTDMTGAVDYRLGADRLIFTDLRATLASIGVGEAVIYWCV